MKIISMLKYNKTKEKNQLRKIYKRNRQKIKNKMYTFQKIIQNKKLITKRKII